MAHPRNFDISIAPVLIELYRKNKKTVSVTEKFFFKPLDLRAHAEIPMEITITSITEHEVSFIYDGELAIFSSYQIVFFTPLFITIVPPIRNLETSRTGTHYMGFICGADEEDKRSLRQLVNFLISATPREIKGAQLSTLLKFKTKPTDTPKTAEEKAAEEAYLVEREKAAKKALAAEKAMAQALASGAAAPKDDAPRVKRRQIKGATKL